MKGKPIQVRGFVIAIVVSNKFIMLISKMPYMTITPP